MAQEKSRLIIKAGDIFDSVKGIVKENQTIVICDNKILWCGENDDFEKESNDTIIEVDLYSNSFLHFIFKRIRYRIIIKMINRDCKNNFYIHKYPIN